MLWRDERSVYLQDDGDFTELPAWDGSTIRSKLRTGELDTVVINCHGRPRVSAACLALVAEALECVDGPRIVLSEIEPTARNDLIARGLLDPRTILDEPRGALALTS